MNTTPLGPGQHAVAASRREEFKELAAKWKRDTRFVSSLTAVVTDPSYQAIMDIGPEALPWILSEFEQTPGQWFWALRHLAKEDPARAIDDFATARRAWLAWGRARGHLGGEEE